MTARHDLVEIVCDGPTGTRRPCPDSAAWTDYGIATALRQRMKADGWICRPPYDRCPKCSVNRRRT